MGWHISQLIPSFAKAPLARGRVVAAVPEEGEPEGDAEPEGEPVEDDDPLLFPFPTALPTVTTKKGLTFPDNQLVSRKL